MAKVEKPIQSLEKRAKEIREQRAAVSRSESTRQARRELLEKQSRDRAAGA